MPDLLIPIILIGSAAVWLSLDALCLKGHGLKTKKTLFSWAFFAEPALLLPVFLYSILVKPVLWELWLVISAVSLVVLVVEAWRLRV